MKDERKTKKQLINELTDLRRRIVQQEKSGNRRLQRSRKDSAFTDSSLKGIDHTLEASLNEVCEALKKISLGYPEVRIPEQSETEIISRLRHMVNMTAKNVDEMVNESHEFAMVLAEHFDVLHRVSNDDFSARVSGISKVELLEALKNVTNGMIENIEKDITKHRKLEETLISEKTFTDSLINSMPGIFYFFDEKGRFIRWNKNFEQVSGYSSEEIANMSPLDFFIGEERELLKKRIREVFSKRESTAEAHLISKDGKRTPYLFSGLLLDMKNKRYLVGMGVDITEREKAEKKLKRNERFLTSVLQSIQDGISVLNNELTIIHVNPTMEQWYKHAMPIVGKKCYAVYHGRELPCEHCPSQKTFKTGNAAYDVVVEKDKKGEIIRYVGLYSFPLFDAETGETGGVIEYVRDITEQKNAEAVLQEREKELQKRVSELEEFYDMAVGRELRMVQLKREIEKLSKDLEKYQT